MRARHCYFRHRCSSLLLPSKYWFGHVCILTHYFHTVWFEPIYKTQIIKNTFIMYIAGTVTQTFIIICRKLKIWSFPHFRSLLFFLLLDERRERGRIQLLAILLFLLLDHHLWNKFHLCICMFYIWFVKICIFVYSSLPPPKSHIW